MNATERFKALNGLTVSRKEIENIIEQAKSENATAVIYRLSKVLNDNPEAKHFDINVVDYQQQQTGLSGAQHTGDYKEALDDCGRLRKGWKFEKGHVVRVEKKEKPKGSKTKKIEKTCKTCKKTTKKETSVKKNEQDLQKDKDIKHIFQKHNISESLISEFEGFIKDFSRKKTIKIDEENSNFDMLDIHLSINGKNEHIGVCFVQPYSITEKGEWRGYYNNEALSYQKMGDYLEDFNKGRKNKGWEEGDALMNLFLTLEDAWEFAQFVKVKKNAPEEKTKKEPKKRYGKVTKREKKEKEQEDDNEVIYLEDLDLSNFIKQPKIAHFDKKGEIIREDVYFKNWYRNTFMQKGIVAPFKKVWGIAGYEATKIAGKAKKVVVKSRNSMDNYLVIIKKSANIEDFVKKQGKEPKKRYGKVTKREKKEKIKKYSLAYFESDLKYDKIYHSYYWSSFEPDKKAQRDIQQWAEFMLELYQSHIKTAIENDVQTAYEAMFDKQHSKLLSLEDEIIRNRANTISTAVTGGAGVKQSQINRSETAHKRIVELSEEQQNYYQKAKEILKKIAKNTPENEYEKGEIIKSTDKFADDKIQQKINQLEAKKKLIYTLEKELKGAKESDYLDILLKNGLEEQEANEKIDFKKRAGYWFFGSPTNINAEIRRLKQRLNYNEKLKNEAQEDGEDKEIEFVGGKIVQNTDEMRLQIHFDEIPTADVREVLKKKAFKWSPKNKVWQRVLTPNAIFDIKQLFKESFFVKKKGLAAPQVPFFKNLNEAKKYFLKWALKHLRGKKIYHKELEKWVIFNRKGIEHTLSSKISFEKMQLILQAEEMLKKSHLIDFQEDYKSREEIKGAYRMRSVGVVEGKDTRVIITLREGENGVIYYDHKLEIENIPTPPRKATKSPQSFCGSEDILDRKNITKTEKNKQKSKKSGLGLPLTAKPAVFVENVEFDSEEDLQLEQSQSLPQTVRRKGSLAEQIANRPTNRKYYQIDNPDMAYFLGKMEVKNTDSLVITLTGGQGSGKTRFAFQFMNDLAQRYKVGHISIEEHPDSDLYEQKVFQYLDERAMNNVEAADVRSLSEVEEIIKRNDVIVIDSFQKLKEIDRNFEIDKDLRKKYNGKLFLVIFQQTTDGKMRGGSKSQFDGDIILFTEKFPDYRENYVYPDKNRYNSVPFDQLKYSIYQKGLLSNKEEDNKTAETNTVYEVIY